MKVDYRLAVEAEYIAGHLRKKENVDVPLLMYHSEAYRMMNHESARATDILYNYRMEVERDIKNGVCRANEYFEKEKKRNGF